MAKSPNPKTTSGARSLSSVEDFAHYAVSLGANAAKVIDASSIETSAWVRLKCQFGCGGFGSSLCCPPHTPMPGEMGKVVAGYEKAILFSADRGTTRDVAVKLEREMFLAGYYKAQGFGAGPCGLCGKEGCDFENGCKHPADARPSMEACGMDVYGTARGNGFEIEVVRDREDKPHFFGVVLVK